jgi:formylglycine-generating enzyme required for sulfatase activity
MALLLVSQKFLVSDFIRKKELPSLFHSAENNGLKILWVPLRPCGWKRDPIISRYQSILKQSTTPLEKMSKVDQEQAMVDIADEIEAIFLGTSGEEFTPRLADVNGEARAEVERWRGEADQLRAELNQWQTAAEQARAEAERLAKEKEEWQQKSKASPPPPVQADRPKPRDPALIEIRARRGWLVQEGNEWRKQEEAITVTGYREELADGIAIPMLRIPEGELLMGSPQHEAERLDDEGPQHRVKLQSFFLGQMPVTQAQWRVVAGWPKLECELALDPSRFKGANRPVEQVSWEEAMEFCHRLRERTQRRYTLPSEAQWEYACRAGTTTPFAFGETLTPELANYDANFIYGSGLEGVYREQTNAWGLHDMHGNVWEWCEDHWHDTYQGAPTDGSAWMSGGDTRRLLRGGSWGNHPLDCRSAFRLRNLPVIRYHIVGFRLCCLPQDLILYT